MVEHPKSWPLVPDAADSSGWGVVGQTHTSKDANAAWRICPSVRWLIGAQEVPPTRLRVLLQHRTARFDSRGFPTMQGTSLCRQVDVQRRPKFSVTARDPITNQNVEIRVPNSRAATTKASLLRQSGYRDIVVERKVAAARKPHDGDE